MRGPILWTPLLHDADERDVDGMNSIHLPKEAAGEAHPLALPRVKQREKRSGQLVNLRRVIPGGESAAKTSVDPNNASMVELVASSDDPVSALSPRTSNSGTKGGARASSDEDKTRVVAVAGLSDDPLSVIMEQRAVARNISRHGGDVLEDEELDLLVPSARSSGPQDTSQHSASGSALGNSGRNPGSGSLGKKLDGSKEQRLGSSKVSRSTGLASGKSNSGEEGKSAGSGWGRRWDAHRQGILREFAVGGEKGRGPDQAAGPSIPGPKTRYESRLAELEANLSGGSGGDTAGKTDSLGSTGLHGIGIAGGLSLTPSEYTTHVADLKSDLQLAWAKEEKVAALKITVQAAKLMGDSSIPTFYPCLFAMIAELLEIFGTLVFERIRARAEELEDESVPISAPLSTLTDEKAGGDSQTGPAPSKSTPVRQPLPEGWTCSEVNAVARETCRNWFYKTACIRELLPRVLVEAALLPCYRFLAEEDEFSKILGRLSTLVRGVGDPIVAVYCRCFIAAAGTKIAPLETAHAAASLQDYLFSFQEIYLGKMNTYLRSSGIGVSKYVHLHTPAVDWLLSIIGPGAPRGVFTKILSHYRNHCGSLEILRLILKHFSPEHYAPFALELAVVIKEGRSGSSQSTIAEVMALLGQKLKAMPPTDSDAVPLLNEAWQEISAAPLDVYIEGAAAWLGVLLCSSAYGSDEVAILVEDVACRVESVSSTDLSNVQTTLAEGIVGALSSDGNPLMLEAAGGHLVKILGVLDKACRAQACLDLLAGFLRVLPLVNARPGATAGSGAPAAASTSSPHSPRQDGASNVFEAEEGGEANGLAAARTLVGVAKLLHDGLDVLAGGERQRRSAVLLTCELVGRLGRGGWKDKRKEHKGEESNNRDIVDEGAMDDRNCLSLLVESRQAFWSMDEVTDRLVLAAAGLAVRSSRRVGSNRNSGAGATTRAALCFCAMTVPSIPSALRRLALLQLCANAALQAGKPSLADSLFRSAISVIPECSTVVVSGADPSAAASSLGRISSSSGSESMGFGRGGGGGARVGNDDPLWGSVGVGGGGGGAGGRKEHAGAWLLADVVRSLLGALVAMPGHPDLGPFYLLRGLLKALRRLPWPAGSGLLASLYMAAVGVLCTMWQKHLPYSIVAPKMMPPSSDTSNPSLASGADASAGPPEEDTPAAASVAASVREGDEIASPGSHETIEASSSPVNCKANGVAFALVRTDGAADAEGPASVVGQLGQDEVARILSASADNVSSGDDANGDEQGTAGVPSAEELEGDDTVASKDGDDLLDAGDKVSPQKDEKGEKERSWISVGGVLGTDKLYLRNKAYLEEVQELLADVMRVTLRDLEELREQSDAEVISSAMGGGQARVARVRYARLTLDLANKLVSCFRMEGGAANVVIFLVEAAVRAGARDGGIDMTAAGGGGIHDRRRRRKHAGYFDETVEFVSDVAKKGLERAREAQRQSGGNSEAEETEEACLTLLQGLSGFAH